jgi:hypothetical protein
MISSIICIIATAVIFAALALLLFYLVRHYLKLRGPRIVACPADNTQAVVEVDALRGTLTVFDSFDLRLSSCSHWPERQDCDQNCLRQIETSPDGCLVRTVLTNWYAGKTCVICGKPCGKIDWMEHKPGLMKPDNSTIEWSQISLQDLLETLKTHRAVCWDCHIATTFRHQHPELVTDRPWKR